jgi:ribosomal protein S18 acetylase RimI-like enzyme
LRCRLDANLLKDALLRIVQAADSIGGRAVLVHVKNDKAKAFYKKFGFEESPIDSFHLYLLLKDLKKTLGI